MSAFTRAEIDYLNEQRLGRLATVGRSGAPHVVPVGFRYNPDTDTIDIGGHDLGETKKWRDIGRDPRVAFVVDDVQPPWKPRLIEVRGEASRLSGGGSLGRGFSDEFIRITPARVVSFGIDAAEDPHARKVGRDVDAQGSEEESSPSTRPARGREPSTLEASGSR